VFWNINGSMKKAEIDRNYVKVSTSGSTGLSRLVVVRTVRVTVFMQFLVSCAGLRKQDNAQQTKQFQNLAL
jgi:hypothetical protein